MKEQVTSDEKVWRFLSYGGGVQTIFLRLAIAKGIIPITIDAAICANTQREPDAVWEQIAWVEEEVARSPYPSPFHVVSRGDLWNSATLVRTRRDGQKKYVKTAIPAYFRNGNVKGLGRRSCTRDFKIAMVNAQARKLMGKPRLYARDGVQMEMIIGITTDEAVLRAKPNPKGYIRNLYPLVDAGYSRADCHAWLDTNVPREIVSSGCVECPHRTDWGMLKPHELARLPESERLLQKAYAEVGFDMVPYLHERRVPISQIKLSTRRRLNMKEEQRNLFLNECAGVCGV